MQVDAWVAILVIPGQSAASSIVTLAAAGIAAALIVVVAIVRLPAGYHRPIPTNLRCKDGKMSAEQTASSPHDEPDDDDGEARYGAAVGELVSWGFERARVLEALEASGGDQQVAANILLG